MLVEDVNLLAGPLSVTDGLLGLKHSLDLLNDCLLLLVRLEVLAGNVSLNIRQHLLDVLQILLEQLVRDNIHVTARVDLTFVVHDVRVGEGSHDVVDAVDSLNVGQEGISEALTGAGT